MRLFHPLWIVGVLAVCVLAFLGCNGGDGAAQSSGQPGEVILNAVTHSDVELATLPYKDGVLILRGTEVPVDLEIGEGPDFVLLIKTHGAVLDSETYRYTENEVGFLGLQGEEFISPIPIIRYPVRDGDEFEWSGKVKDVTAQSRLASAKIRISSETLNLPIGVFQAIRSDVALELESGAEEPATRDLVFWVVPDHGVMKAQFGHSYTRQPRSTLAATGQ